MDALSMFGNELNTKAKILILFANTYDMLDEKQQQRTGYTVHYLFWGEDGEQFFTQSEWDPNKPVGIQRAKCSIDMSLRAKIPFAPAVYEGDFRMTVGSDGKPVLKLCDVAYVSHIDVKGKTIPGMVVPGMVVQEAPAPESPKSDKSDSKKA